MKLMHITAALLFAGPGILMAQSVPFHTLGKGAIGPVGSQATNLVFRSDQEFRASGLDRHAQAGAQIDWSREMVLACLQGTQSRGGYSITVEQIELRQAGIPTLVVSLRLKTPAPGAPAPAVITSPYHLVRVQRHDPVAFEVLPQPPAAPFERASLALDLPAFGVPVARRIEIEVSRDGAAVALSREEAPGQAETRAHGQATADELRALERAVEGAQAGSLPDPLPPAAGPLGNHPFFSLQVISGRQELAGTTRGRVHEYGAFQARVAPLVEALRAIGDRLLADAQGREYTGRIELPPGGGIRLVEAGGQSFRLQPEDQASQLARFRGKTVRLRATREQTGGDTRLTIQRLLSPEQRSLEGLVRQIGSRAELFPGHPGQPASRFVPTSGQAAAALRLAVGRRVRCDAQVFTAPDGAVLEAVILSVEAVVRTDAPLLRAGQPFGIVRAGQLIHVLSLPRLGGLALIKADPGIGWVPRDRLEVGTADAPIPGPIPLTPGLSGAVGGATGD